MAQTVKPAAFMSYARSDDKLLAGRLSEFREYLTREVQLQTGYEFAIFQDVRDIHWGQNWRQRIEESLDAVTFLLPIITPSFFRSANCRSELKRFLERERRLKRQDLVLPVYFIQCSLLEDPETSQQDPLVRAIAEHNYADWRDLRFETLHSPVACKRLEWLAIQVRDAIERAAPRKFAPSAPEARFASKTAEQKKERSEPPFVPPTHIVDLSHRGTHLRISDAIQAASPGDRIIVRPGLYREALVIEKALEIVGEGKAEDIVIEGHGGNAILFRTTMGRVENVTLRQSSGGAWHTVDITQGRLELERCVITSHNLACVAVHDYADPRIRRNTICGSQAAGVYFYGNGNGLLEDNDIYDNAGSGVEVRSSSNPTVRRNSIRDGRTGGVYVYDKGEGLYEDNDITRNAFSGVAVTTGSNPVFRRNRIHNSRTSDVYLANDARGLFEDNDIYGNVYAGVEIVTDSNPVLRRNHIHGSESGGVYIHSRGRGVLEYNEIYENRYSGVAITEGGCASLRDNRVWQNGYFGVCLYEDGAGTFEQNDLRGNKLGAFEIRDCDPSRITRVYNLEI